MSLVTTPRTWVTAEVVTATEMNTEIRDAFTGIQAAWASWTPTWVNMTPGNGSTVATFLQIGKTVFWSLDFVAGSTTAYAGGQITFTLPTAVNASVPNGSVVGSCTVSATSNSAPVYPGAITLNTSPAVRFAMAAGPAFLTNAAPATLGTATGIHATGVYSTP